MSSTCSATWLMPTRCVFMERETNYPGSAVPANRDLALGVRQRQRPGVHLDRRAFRTSEPAPRIDREIRLRASPRPDDLACDEHGARPDARRPELRTAHAIRDEQLTAGAPEQEVRVPA